MAPVAIAVKGRTPGFALRHLLTLLCAVVGIGGVALYFGGFRVHVVETASMSPAIPSGALVTVRPEEIRAIDIGDVISFTDPSNPRRTVLHRVVGEVQSARGRLLQTKGDANPAMDSLPVGSAELHGVSVSVIPRGGLVGRVLADGRAPALFVGAPLLCWLSAIAHTPLTEFRNRKRSKS